MLLLLLLLLRGGGGCPSAHGGEEAHEGDVVEPVVGAAAGVHLLRVRSQQTGVVDVRAAEDAVRR